MEQARGLNENLNKRLAEVQRALEESQRARAADHKLLDEVHNFLHTQDRPSPQLEALLQKVSSKLDKVASSTRHDAETTQALVTKESQSIRETIACSHRASLSTESAARHSQQQLPLVEAPVDSPPTVFEAATYRLPKRHALPLLSLYFFGSRFVNTCQCHVVPSLLSFVFLRQKHPAKRYHPPAERLQ